VPIHVSREIRNHVSGFPLDEPQKEEGKAARARPHRTLIRVKKEQGWERTPSGGVLIHIKMLKGHHSVLKSTP
jgi:hypothetical protein